MTKDAALQLALEALETIDLWLKARYEGVGLVGTELDTIAAIREALALPVQTIHLQQVVWHKTAEIQRLTHLVEEKNLQKLYADLHLYEEINQYYAKCNPGPENLRDWVAERMDKPAQS